MPFQLASADVAGKDLPARPALKHRPMLDERIADKPKAGGHFGRPSEAQPCDRIAVNLIERRMMLHLGRIAQEGSVGVVRRTKATAQPEGQYRPRQSCKKLAVKFGVDAHLPGFGLPVRSWASHALLMI